MKYVFKNAIINACRFWKTGVETIHELSGSAVDSAAVVLW
jgi:hypothetical protein